MNYPSNYECPLKDAHTLPASSETGVLIHRILEKLAFSSFANLKEPTEAIPLIRALRSIYSL